MLHLRNDQYEQAHPFAFIQRSCKLSTAVSQSQRLYFDPNGSSQRLYFDPNGSASITTAISRSQRPFLNCNGCISILTAVSQSQRLFFDPTVFKQ